MRRLLVVGSLFVALAMARPAAAQAGISLGAGVGSSWHDSKISSDDLHGLVYLRLGLPLVPYGARGDFLVFDAPDAGTEMALIGSAVMSLNAPLIQPYALLGIGKYGFGDNSQSGFSFGAGVRIGGKRGLFVEGRRHDPINRTLLSLGIAF
ncbi:MAG TPA: hypothetical protein VH762_08480 [Gemmatimonadaceae bacterium]|jgi:hypothetical protein